MTRLLTALTIDRQSNAALIRALAVIAITMMLGNHAAHGGDLYSVASTYIGMTERGHRKSLRKMLGVDPVRVQWCGAALAYFARKAGYKPPSGHNVAASWSRFGRAVSMRQIKRGDVVVLRGHVTVFTKLVKGKVCGVGGNQSNAIKESCYRASRVVAVRRAK